MRRGWPAGPAARAAAVTSLVAVCTALAGCGGPGRAVAVWQPSSGESIDAGTTSFVAQVSRLGCNDGITGEANEPEITLTPDEVVVTFTVSPGNPEGFASCPDPIRGVRAVVTLPEPLGDRALVDGACLEEPAAATSRCLDGGVRRPAP